MVYIYEATVNENVIAFGKSALKCFVSLAVKYERTACATCVHRSQLRWQITDNGSPP
jgi:hypothetical protein